MFRNGIVWYSKCQADKCPVFVMGDDQSRLIEAANQHALRMREGR